MQNSNEKQYTQYLTEKEIKERLLAFGQDGNPKFARIANDYASMEGIITAISAEGLADEFAKLYFNGNQDVVNAVSAYKENKTACEYVLKNIFLALMYQPENVKLVADAFNQQKVKDLVFKLKDDDLIAAMKCFGIAARYIKDKNVVFGYLAKIADSASTNLGPGFKKYMETIEAKIFFGLK